MTSAAAPAIVARIRDGGPLTVARFMELALYDPETGYYATASRRSGRSGDFFTSVDVGPLFGEMLAVQIAEIDRILQGTFPAPPDLDVVEAGAGDGRLARDILDALARDHPGVYERIRFTAVERSASARRTHDETLAAHVSRITSCAALPTGIAGVVLANELLDALPVHVVTSTTDGLREIYVCEREGRLREMLGPLSDPAISRWLDQSGVTLEPGQRTEVALAADDWIHAAGAALTRGFLLLFDYCRPAGAAAHPDGTLLGYRRHTAGVLPYFAMPGACDLTAHVDLSALRRSAARAGLIEVGAVDQLYFLTALGITDRLEQGFTSAGLARRLAAKTLLVPGGLGSTMKALAFSKDVADTVLRGFRAGRLT
jgi:SAM-dependent MidA family methyltransferase